MNSVAQLFGIDRQNFIFPIYKLVSTFPCNENKDGVEYVALIQKLRETEKDMFMLLDDNLRIHSISRNVTKYLKLTPLMIHEQHFYIYQFNQALQTLKDFVTEEFLVLTLPESSKKESETHSNKTQGSDQEKDNTVPVMCIAYRRKVK